MMTRCAQLAGFGGYLPRRVVTNDDLAMRMDTSDQWIRGRTGIRQRHIADEDETATFMAVEAARGALAYADVDAAEVDAVIVATSTPDQIFPATALRVQSALGTKAGGFGFDVSAACCGFICALEVADSLIRSGQADNILVIGSEVYSRIVDWGDRGTCVLFGDGAGAVLLRSGERRKGSREAGVLSVHMHSDGSLGDILFVDGALGRKSGSGYLRMNGREVFRHAVAKLSDSVDEALRLNELDHKDVTWLVPHQANLRIIEAMRRKLDLPSDRVVVTIDEHANTSAASIPLALNRAIRDGRIKPGDMVLMEALGGGLVWGAALAVV